MVEEKRENLYQNNPSTDKRFEKSAYRVRRKRYYFNQRVRPAAIDSGLHDVTALHVPLEYLLYLYVPFT